MDRSPARDAHALARLLARAGLTQDAFARLVNRVAAESGHALALDRRSVTHWLSGRSPRPPVPAFAAEALSRVLGQQVTPDETGLTATATPSAGTDPLPDKPAAPDVSAASGTSDMYGGEPNPSNEDVVAVLTRLATHDRSRRKVIGAAAYSLAAVRSISWFDAHRAVSTSSAPPAALNEGAVAAAESTAHAMSVLDQSRGGGVACSALAAILAHDIAPRLSAGGSARLTTRMFSAATTMTYLCGFTHFDDARHEQAQQYYLAALDLARHNADPGAYAITLRALSVQAYTLGHHREAAQMAEAADSAGYRALAPIQQAFLLGQCAVAVAADGDRQAAITALSAAERRLDQATSTNSRSATEPSGQYHPSALAHQEAEVRAALGDRTGAIHALTESLRHRPPGELRSRALTRARLARLHLLEGHLEQACADAQLFLDDYPQLLSGRASQELRELSALLRPHRAHPAARAVLDRAHAITT